MTTAIVIISLIVIVLLSYLLFSHRRRILALDVDIASLPDIRSGLTQIAGLTGGVIFDGNAAQIYQNGALLHQMMDDIRRAKHTVHFETYLWKKGNFERRLVDLFCQKSKEGVVVRVLIDAMGAIRAHDKQLKKLRNAGVELIYFRHFKQLNLYHFNNRMHRKVLVVDGRIGYTCGHGVTDEWLGNAQDKDHWRDTGVRLTGPVVHSIQSVFTHDWCASSRRVPVGEGCFPEQERTGDLCMHVVRSSTKSRDSSVALFYMMAMASAKHEIIIQNPYFIPDGHIPQLLMEKAKAGVQVHLMLPGKHTDSKLVRRAGQRLYHRLLSAGVNVYEFGPTMMHQKIVVVDGVWSHIGTTNLDIRSLALNAEMGVGILGEAVAQELREAFEQDLQRSERIHLQDWINRPLSLKTLEWLAFQVRGQI